MEDFPDIKNFNALADAAAADRLSSQRALSTALDAPIHRIPAHQTNGSATAPAMSQSRTPSSAAQGPDDDVDDEEEDEEEEGDFLDGQPPPLIGSDISAWETAIQTLPAEFSSTRRFAHPLASMLADQKTIRQIEWNPNRQNGGFVPRTPHDFSAMMIFICGQVNPNPCRNCRLQNGPFARCIVAPPEVLAISTIKHACANCCYQNQHRRCTNDPITHEERVRSQVGRAPRNGCKVRKPKPQKNQPSRAPRADSRPSYDSQVVHHSYGGGSATQTLPALGKPSAESGSVKSFAEKVQMARVWNQQSRRKMKAELLQWQAALATVDAERPRKTANPSAIQPAPPPPPPQQRPQQHQQPQAHTHSFPRPSLLPATPKYSHQTMPSSSYPQYASAIPNGRAPVFQPSGDVSMGDQDDFGSDITDSEEGDGGGEDHMWAGFDDDENRVMIKPPVL
ncbi:hypothetical protein PG999_012419 [Apiospora kogelbergensis]|uniref:Uncharacterized protein n=1 Tax=Apiospora kogelbergensis TaxID=1337665 RepID=A0AAW0Q6W1_9PEZI